MRAMVAVLSLFAGLAGICNAEDPIRLLVITGSHGFDPRFYGLFEGHPDIQWDKMTQAGDPCRAYSEGFAEGYDAVLLYDFEMSITEDQKKAFENAFGGGRGLIVLHHALCSHPSWPKYREIAGGQFLFEAQGDLPQSTYKGDQEVTYTPVKSDHPATQGVGSFTVTEEPYKHVYRPEGVTPLLTVSHPESDEVVAWATQHQESRVAAIEPGHGGEIFDKPEYKKFIAQTIRWVAGREEKAGE